MVELWIDPGRQYLKGCFTRVVKAGFAEGDCMSSMGSPCRSVQTEASIFFVWPGLSQLLFEAVF